MFITTPEDSLYRHDHGHTRLRTSHVHACLWKEQCRFPSYLLGQDQAAAVQGGLLAHSCTHNAAVQADFPSPLLFPSELSLLRCMSFSWDFSCVFVVFGCFRVVDNVVSLCNSPAALPMSYRLATCRLLSPCQCCCCSYRLHSPVLSHAQTTLTYL